MTLARGIGGALLALGLTPILGWALGSLLSDLAGCGAPDVTQGGLCGWTARGMASLGFLMPGLALAFLGLGLVLMRPGKPRR